MALVIVALGMFFGLVGPQIQQFQDWSQATSPAFIGEVLIQIGVVIGAWVAGQLSPGGKVAKSISSSLSGTGTGDGR
jgi:hypothetical protein